MLGNARDTRKNQTPCPPRSGTLRVLKKQLIKQPNVCWKIKMKKEWLSPQNGWEGSVWGRTSSSRCPGHCFLARVKFFSRKNVSRVSKALGRGLEMGRRLENWGNKVFRLLIYMPVSSYVRMRVLGGRRGLWRQDPWRHTASLACLSLFQLLHLLPEDCRCWAPKEGDPYSPNRGLKRRPPQWSTGPALSSTGTQAS